MSLVSGTIPAIPLSQLNSPLATNSPAPESATTETVIIPPAFAGQGRGFSALNFGLTPPANNGTAEAGLQAINDALDAVRGDVDDAQARTEASLRLTAIGLSNEELANLAKALDELNTLVSDTIPEQQQQVNEAAATVTARQGDVTTSQNALAAAEANLAAVDPASPEAEPLRQEVDAARADLASAQEALSGAQEAKRAEDQALNALEAHADELRSATLPQALEAAGLAGAAVPQLSNGDGDDSPSLLSDLLGEEAFAQVVHDIVANTETNLYDVAIVNAALDDIAQDLGDVRVAKVGLAFSTVFATLQEALNAMAAGSELASSSAGALSSSGEQRLRLPLGGVV